MPELTTTDLFYLLLAVAGGFVLAVWLVVSHLTAREEARSKAEQARAREETRREIAAYVAEGSISAQDAALLLAAGTAGEESSRALVAAMLAGRGLTPEQAERLAGAGGGGDIADLRAVLKELGTLGGVKIVVD